jgi:hypothetical protein
MCAMPCSREDRARHRRARDAEAVGDLLLRRVVLVIEARRRGHRRVGAGIVWDFVQHQ